MTKVERDLATIPRKLIQPPGEVLDELAAGPIVAVFVVFKFGKYLEVGHVFLELTSRPGHDFAKQPLGEIGSHRRLPVRNEWPAARLVSALR